MQSDGIELHSPKDPIEVKSFSVIGERSSGTNLAYDLLKTNIKIPFVAVHRWKHGFPDAHVYPKNHLMVVCFRKADDWVRSMYAKPWEAHPIVYKRNFHEFLREPWYTAFGQQYGLTTGDIHGIEDRIGERLFSDSHPITGRPFRNIVLLRNMKNHAFLSMSNRLRHVVFVQLEYLQVHQEAFVSQLSEHYDLPRHQSFHPIEFQHGQNRYWAKRLEEKPKRLSQDDHEFLLSQLDLELEKRLGYEY